MHWGSVLGAGLAAAVATSLTDWFFFGVWMHDRYNTFPEVWRPVDAGGSYRKAIAASAVLNAIACFGLVGLLSGFGLTGWGPALGVSAGVWLLVPMPMIAVNTMLMRLDPWLLVPHGLGHLARLVLCGVATAALVG